RYKADRQRKVQGMLQPAIDAIDAIEPYKGGKGHQLWVLQELNNLSKHRELIAVGSAFRSVDLGGHMLREMGKTLGRALPEISAFYGTADRMCPLKVGDELFIDLPDAEPDEKMQFRFDVALNE